MSGADDFWSRRKARVQAEAEAEAAEAVRAKEAAEQAEREEQSDEQILQELGLPDPDSLQPGDDYSGFMARGVPERLRRRALRKLWVSNPVLANLDGLVEYGEDYTDATRVVDGMKTSYQVGKGMLAHVLEMARQAEAAELAAETPANEQAGDPADSEDSLDSIDKTSQSEGNSEIPTARDEVTQALTDEADDSFAPAPRRRMRFAFAAQDAGPTGLRGKEHE